MSKIELCNAFQRVIGTIGYAGAGKDEVAKQLSIPSVAFSDALKNRCDTLAKSFGLNLDKREDKQKFREVLVAVGRLGRSIDPDYWIKRLVLPDAPTVAVTGVRYLNECHAIQEVGGTLACVVRPGVLPANEEEAKSIHEIVQAAYHDEIDVVQIDNDGDTNTLRINAAAALDYPLYPGFSSIAPVIYERASGEHPDFPRPHVTLREESEHPDVPRYATQGTPQDFEFGCEEVGCPICGLANCDLEATLAESPLAQVNVIDGDDAIPYLKSLQGDFRDVVIYRGSLPPDFTPDENGTVVLLPERAPVPYELAAVELAKPGDAVAVSRPTLEYLATETSHQRAMRRWFEAEPLTEASVIYKMIPVDPSYFNPPTPATLPWYLRLARFLGLSNA